MSQLDPQAQSLLDAAANSGLPPVYELPAVEARQRMRSAFISPDPITKVEIADLRIPNGGPALRTFRADQGSTSAGLFYFHGGGWTVNDLDTHSYLCGELAKISGAQVISIDFDCAPEAKYPVALRQCANAVIWCCKNSHNVGFDPLRIGLMGDSSGGTLALGVAQSIRGILSNRAMVLAYPVADYINLDLESYRTCGNGYSLNNDFMEWSWRNYLPEVFAADDGLLFPLRAKELGPLPPTMILTAEFDPLRSEGALLAERLRNEGIDTTHLHADGQMHGFLLQTRKIDAARLLLDEVGAYIRRSL